MNDKKQEMKEEVHENPVLAGIIETIKNAQGNDLKDWHSDGWKSPQ